jgi:hypothetical protein
MLSVGHFLSVEMIYLWGAATVALGLAIANGA